MQTQNANLNTVLTYFDTKAPAHKEEINFLLDNGVSVNDLINDYDNQMSNGIRANMIIFTVLDNQRKLLLDRTRYVSAGEFADDYKTAPRKALSRLFGEFIDLALARHVMCSGHDAEYIYHVAMQKPYDRLMRVALYI